MPHLDANALVTDAEGLAFLHDVIGVPAPSPSRQVFDAARSTTRVKRVLPLEAEKTQSRRRKGAVPEAA